MRREKIRPRQCLVEDRVTVGEPGVPRLLGPPTVCGPPCRGAECSLKQSWFYRGRARHPANSGEQVAGSVLPEKGCDCRQSCPSRGRPRHLVTMAGCPQGGDRALRN